MITPSSPASKRILMGFAAVLGMALAAFEALPAQAAPPPHAPAWGYRRKQAATNKTPNRNTRSRDWSHNRRTSSVPAGYYRDRNGRLIRRRAAAVPAGYYRDRNGRLIRRRAAAVPAGYYRERNGRLIRRRAPAKTVNQHPVWRKINRRTGDRDDDGIRNRRDRDMDGDGIRNRRDRDRDNDGVRNRRDRYDRRPNRK